MENVGSEKELMLRSLYTILGSSAHVLETNPQIIENGRNSVCKTEI
jgi:hypothetical protein